MASVLAGNDPTPDLRLLEGREGDPVNVYTVTFEVNKPDDRAIVSWAEWVADYEKVMTPVRIIEIRHAEADHDLVYRAPR